MNLHHQVRGSGPPIILLHGLFGTGSNLGTIAREFEVDHTVHLLDARNHGRSDWSTSISYPEMAADVAAYIEEYRLDDVILIGHSMGGKTAMQLALTEPARIAGLIILDIAPVAYGGHHADILAALAAVAEHGAATRADADAHLALAIDDVGIRSFLMKSFVPGKPGYDCWRMNVQVIRSQYDQLAAAVSGTPFTGPVLFVAGGDSDYVRESHRPDVMARFPNAAVRVLAGTGHWLHAEKPAQLNRTVRRFLATHVAA